MGRQLDDCRAKAAELGWRVGDEYVDNDISAFGGKRRPAYERMLADIEAGDRDAVVVYHQDRLTRRPIELEHFVETVTRAGVSRIEFVTGPAVDLGSGDGLMVLRIMGAVAASESSSKSRRVRRKMDAVAAEGRPHGGAQQAFGYGPDKITVVPSESAVIRELAERYLAGESVRSLAQWLEDSGVRSRSGKPWRTTTVKQMLCSGRIAGLREHRGVVVGPAVWEPIITPEMHDRLLAKFNEKARTGRRVPRSYLLSGLLRCGRCDGKLFSSRRETSRRYVCAAGPDHGGCGKLTVVAAPVEELITEAVLFRLDSPTLADALVGKVAENSDAYELSEALSADRHQLEELGGMWGRKEINASEWAAAKAPIQQRIKETERRLVRVSHSDALLGFVGTPGLRERWSTLNLTRQRAIVEAVLEFAIIEPKTTAGTATFNPDRVRPHWRL